MKIKKLGAVYQKLFLGRCFCCNFSHHLGGRIMLAWNEFSFHVNIKMITYQLIHYDVKSISG